MTIESTAVRLALVAATAALVAGCAGTGGGYRYLVSAGSEVQLHQTLRLPANSPRVHIQGGRVVSTAEIDRFTVHCSFGLERQDDEALVETIEPDRFQLPGPSRSGYWVEGPAGGVRVAARGMLTAGMLFEDDGPPEYTFYTELPLRSARQPQVDDLTCRYDAAQFPYIAGDPPTLEQINAALGAIATVRPAGTDG